MKLFVGIEGIGMGRSVAVLSDAEGKVLGWASGRSLRFLEQPESLRTTLFELLRDVTKRAGLSMRHLKNVSLCIGMSDATTPYECLCALPEMLQQCDLNLASDPVFTTDGEVVFASHTHARNGSAIVCNAGLTISIINDGETFRLGGWGSRLGDLGSGRAIGLAAVRQVCNEWTGGEEPSLLWHEVDSWLDEPSDTAERMILISRKWKQAKLEMNNKEHDVRGAMFFFVKHLLNPFEWDIAVSNLVLPVMRAADQRDASANQILELTAETITKQYLAVARSRWNRISGAPTVFYGGVFTHHPLFRQRVIQSIEESVRSRLHAIFPGDAGTMRPAFGALLFALGGSTPKAHRLPPAAVYDQVFATVEDLNSKGECLND